MRDTARRVYRRIRPLPVATRSGEAARDRTAEPLLIPRVFHQIWLGPDPLPPEFSRYRETWKEHHPGWEHRLWTEESLPRELRRPEARDRLRHPAERSDILRLELLWRHGGVYLDVDLECLRPIEPLLGGLDFFCAYLKADQVNNAILGAVAGHPILDRALDEVRPREYYGFDKAAAGPVFVNELLAAYPDVALFEPELFYPNTPQQRETAYAVHHQARSWKDAEGFRIAALLAEERLEQAQQQIARLERDLAKTRGPGESDADLPERIEELATAVEALARDEGARAKTVKKRHAGLELRVTSLERSLDADATTDDLIARELAMAASTRRTEPVPVHQPLVLISQIARSGGTLLGQLFDCHPQCHVHPQELRFAPGPMRWPSLDLDASPEAWWELLDEREPAAHFVSGYSKTIREGDETSPFLFMPSLARALFHDLVATGPIESTRDILDAYLTAFFNAWLDNQNLYGPDKRWVVAFSPGMVSDEGDRSRFFETYADGRLISIVREPKSWYVSASAFKSGSYGDLTRAMELWCGSVSASLAASEAHPDHVLLVPFEALVRDTRDAMARVTSFLDIELDDVCLQPTFNNNPIKAHSSFAVRDYGVLSQPGDRASRLDPEIAEEIDRLSADVYEAALEKATATLSAPR